MSMFWQSKRFPGARTWTVGAALLGATALAVPRPRWPKQRRRWVPVASFRSYPSLAPSPLEVRVVPACSVLRQYRADRTAAPIPQGTPCSGCSSTRSV